jgi:hypothetical protein
VVPSAGSWLSRWTSSRRRLAEKPICRSAGRLVSRRGDGEVVGVVDGGFCDTRSHVVSERVEEVRLMPET